MPQAREHAQRAVGERLERRAGRADGGLDVPRQHPRLAQCVLGQRRIRVAAGIGNVGAVAQRPNLRARLAAHGRFDDQAPLFVLLQWQIRQQRAGRDAGDEQDRVTFDKGRRRRGRAAGFRGRIGQVNFPRLDPLGRRAGHDPHAASLQHFTGILGEVTFHLRHELRARF